MGMNETPSSNRFHIGFFGLRNAGKSSLFNAFACQELAVVSDTPGTTTDPVTKAMELAPAGPVVIIDTPGLDDVGELGLKRVNQAKKILRRCDVVLLVCDSSKGISEQETNFYAEVKSAGIPCFVVFSKTDLTKDFVEQDGTIEKPFAVTVKNPDSVDKLRSVIGNLLSKNNNDRPLASDLLPEGGKAILVVPIDKAAPKGRLILPQQQVCRDLLDSGCSVVFVRDTELEGALKWCVPDIVITDSQVFASVAKIVPENIPMTSFSILLARYKGVLDSLSKGAFEIDNLQDGDKILISEGCTHHRQCEDIGTVKLPALIKKYTQKNITFETSSGNDFPENLEEYKLILHCGGCMITDREMKYRLTCAKSANIPMTNYGTAIAYMNGILKRSLKPLGNI